MVWSSFEILCIYDHIPTSSVSFKNAAIECEIKLSELGGLCSKDMEVGGKRMVSRVGKKGLWGFMEDCYQI